MNKIGAFVAGGMVGACIALACAPQVGRDTRAAVVDKANAAWGSAQGVVSGEISVKDVAANVSAQAKDLAQNVTAQAQTLAGKAQEAAASVQTKVQDAANGAAAATSNDELREKIEAARQRIAAQVVKNVEESQAVATEAAEAAEPIEAEVEVVEAAAEAEADAE